MGRTYLITSLLFEYVKFDTWIYSKNFRVKAILRLLLNHYRHCNEQVALALIFQTLFSEVLGSDLGLTPVVLSKFIVNHENTLTSTAGLSAR
jgi:hypothetical protein